jgi:nicotinamidase/pyrazinamidase
MPKIINRIEKKDGLLLVDVQKDFCPGGLLAIDEGDQVVPILNRWIMHACENKIPIYASRDWHPVCHISFKEQGGRWPPHCIQDSKGAQFHEDLNLGGDVVKITKGVRFDRDQNSVFDQTGFTEQLRRDKIKRLWIGGLALDFCVKASVMDALREGLDVFLLKEATRPVTPEGGHKAIALMRRAGAGIVT